MIPVAKGGGIGKLFKRKNMLKGGGKREAHEKSKKKKKKKFSVLENRQTKNFHTGRVRRNSAKTRVNSSKFLERHRGKAERKQFKKKVKKIRKIGGGKGGNGETSTAAPGEG